MLQRKGNTPGRPKVGWSLLIIVLIILGVFVFRVHAALVIVSIFVIAVFSPIVSIIWQIKRALTPRRSNGDRAYPDS
jgi:hypothetical protein